MLSVFFKPNCLFCNSFINISIVLKKNVKKRTTLKQRSVAKWIIFFIHKRFTEIMYSMTSSSPPKLQQQQVNASLRDLLCAHMWVNLRVSPSLPLLCCFPPLVSNFKTFFAAGAHWRKWRDSALRHRKGHIQEANAAPWALLGSARLGSASNARPKISTTRALRESSGGGGGTNDGRFVQWCSSLHQRNPDRTAGHDRLSASWMENSDVAWHASKQTLVSLVQSAAACWRSDLNLLCHSGVRWVSRSTCSDKKTKKKKRKERRMCEERNIRNAVACAGETFA